MYKRMIALALSLMLALLATGVLKPAQIQPVSRFLIAVMPVMFLPTCVGIMDVADQLLPVLLPFLVVCIVGSALVMAVSGRVAQAAIRREIYPGTSSRGMPSAMANSPFRLSSARFMKCSSTRPNFFFWLARSLFLVWMDMVSRIKSAQLWVRMASS